MQIPRPAAADKELFTSLVNGLPEVEIKPMFANLGAFVHGNMFAGLFGDLVGVRLGEPTLTELRAIDGTAPFGPRERPMSGYVSLAATWRGDPDRAAEWIERAHSYVSALPPKIKTPKVKRGTTG